MTDGSRGTERERDLDRDVYFSDSYFSMDQLCSFAHQLNFIHSMRPTSAIEIGLGNGFVSTFLRRAGIPVITADINAALEPDICAPLGEVSSHIESLRDVVICCEVLEHMPLEELDANLDHLRSLGDRLFLTLPNSYRSWGFSGPSTPSSCLALSRSASEDATRSTAWARLVSARSQSASERAPGFFSMMLWTRS